MLQMVAGRGGTCTCYLLKAVPDNLGTSTNPVSEALLGRNRRLTAGKGRCVRKLSRLRGFLAAGLAVWADGSRDATSGGDAAL